MSKKLERIEEKLNKITEKANKLNRKLTLVVNNRHIVETKRFNLMKFVSVSILICITLTLVYLGA